MQKFKCNKYANVLHIPVTNPIDVIKIRMQLDNELAQTKGDVKVALKYV